MKLTLLCYSHIPHQNHTLDKLLEITYFGRKHRRDESLKSARGYHILGSNM